LGVTPRPVGTGREQRDVDAGGVGDIEVFDLHFSPARLDLGSGRATRGHEAQVVDGEVALLEYRKHGAAHHTGGADDGDVGHAGTFPNSKASWRTRTASSTRSSRMTQEMRIVDVEIISTLMFAVANAWNTLAATPGCDFIPAPTSDTLAISSSTSTAPASSSMAIFSAMVRARSA